MGCKAVWSCWAGLGRAGQLYNNIGSSLLGSLRTRWSFRQRNEQFLRLPRRHFLKHFNVYLFHGKTTHELMKSSENQQDKVKERRKTSFFLKYEWLAVVPIVNHWTILIYIKRHAKQDKKCKYTRNFFWVRIKTIQVVIIGMYKATPHARTS